MFADDHDGSGDAGAEEQIRRKTACYQDAGPLGLKTARTEHAKSDFTKENTGQTRDFRQLLLDIQTDGEGVTKKRNYRPTYREITGKNLMDFEFASADGPPG